ncbi:unnamed protein product [Prorocentrum cordatum]|uniref:Uncharacterized protein n=1 Tax=Prorocentrum cordatum TaxID=2364126 RepID=A0ABN9R3D6_9DINO|nr:unnamed protein product [Polarella glacialis]
MRRRRVRSARGRGSPRRWSLNREGGDQGEGREEEGGVERPGITNYGGWAPGARRRLASERVRARHRRRRRRERGQGRQVERSGPGRCATRAGGPARKAAPEPPAATAGGPGLHPDRACEQREMREGGAEAGGQRREGGLARMGANAGLAALR